MTKVIIELSNLIWNDSENVMKYDMTESDSSLCTKIMNVKILNPIIKALNLSKTEFNLLLVSISSDSPKWYDE